MSTKPNIGLPEVAVHSVLRGLMDRKIPSRVSAQLRAVAARERLRRISPPPSFWSVWRTRLSLSVNDLMRPLALPFAGGLLSSVALFGIWLSPTYPLLSALKTDIPLTVTTEAGIRSMGEIGVASPDVVVDVYLDGGLFAGYKIVSGAESLLDATARRRLENRLIQMQFTSATAFGRPTPSTMRVYFRSDSVDVRG